MPILGHENLDYRVAFERMAKVLDVQPPTRLLPNLGMVGFGWLNSLFASIFGYHPQSAMNWPKSPATFTISIHPKRNANWSFPNGTEQAVKDCHVVPRTQHPPMIDPLYAFPVDATWTHDTTRVFVPIVAAPCALSRTGSRPLLPNSGAFSALTKAMKPQLGTFCVKFTGFVTMGLVPLAVHGLHP